MRHLLVLLLSFVISVTYSQGIEFESLGFTEALEKAKKENKLIFLDAYTTWCGPCKQMSKNIFTDEKVGSYFNDKFVNIKVDMEKGEGKALAKKYEVKYYPSLLFINGDAKLMHKSIGAQPVDDFLDLGMAANDPDRQITTLTERFIAGERDLDFLKKYVDAKTKAGESDFESITKVYMDQQSDWLTEENIQFIFDYSDPSMDSELFVYSVEHKDDFISVVGEESWNQKITYAAEMDRAKQGISRDDVVSMKSHFSKYMSSKDAYNIAMSTYIKHLMYSKNKEDHEKFLTEVQLFLATDPDVGAKFYNSVAWEMYILTDDKNLLKKAVNYVEKSIKGEKSSFNTDTMAVLQFKLGNNKKAEKYAIESIKLAQEEGNDYSSTQELLDKINAAK